jgi:tight adherence protein C
MFFKIAIIVAGLIVSIWAILMLVYRLTIARSVRDRVFTDDALPESVAREGVLTNWLIIAGIRSPSAPAVFIVAVTSAALIGLVLVLVFYSTGAAAATSQLVEQIPGGVGNTFAPLFYASPWILFLILAAMPILFVRRLRLERIALIEQDLPLALDLLATLSESGLGFDTALARVLETRIRDRPLASELRTFQSDLLAGRSRVQALRRLARRTEVPSISIFVSALVQAEQMGMGLAGILRRQADDLRDRRRERANTFAMSLPVKRLVPMVICFLPAIFVWAIGPVMLPLMQVFDRIIQQAGR